MESFYFDFLKLSDYFKNEPEPKSNVLILWCLMQFDINEHLILSQL